jgi:hypothetical protein
LPWQTSQQESCRHWPCHILKGRSALCFALAKFETPPILPRRHLKLNRARADKRQMQAKKCLLGKSLAIKNPAEAGFLDSNQLGCVRFAVFSKSLHSKPVSLFLLTAFHFNVVNCPASRCGTCGIVIGRGAEAQQHGLTSKLIQGEA